MSRCHSRVASSTARADARMLSAVPSGSACGAARQAGHSGRRRGSSGPSSPHSEATRRPAPRRRPYGMAAARCRRARAPGGARVGGDEDDQLVVFGDGEHVAVDVQRAGLRVGHRLGAVAGGAHRAAVPELGELAASGAEFRQRHREPVITGDKDARLRFPVLGYRDPHRRGPGVALGPRRFRRSVRATASAGERGGLAVGAG